MAVASTETRPKREMKILSMGLPRTGTASMWKALEILGYKDVYHGLAAIDSPTDWEILNRAADATFPNLPTYTGKKFTQDDWEELYGPCEATTDVASVFGRDLIEAYPDAKVVLVVRDYDKWFKSIDEGVFCSLWGAPATFSINFVEPLLGSVAGIAARKLMVGMCGAKENTLESVRAGARDTYDRHHREVRAATRPGQLLEYRLGEGWAPLCEFLGKPVPDEEFPWVNEAAALKAKVREQILRNARRALRKMLPWAVGMGAVAVGSWTVAKQNGYLS